MAVNRSKFLYVNTYYAITYIMGYPTSNVKLAIRELLIFTTLLVEWRTLICHQDLNDKFESFLSTSNPSTLFNPELLKSAPNWKLVIILR